MKGRHVLICVAWPYANGPLHLGHVAGCYLPPDIQFRYQRALGNRVLMVSGSDEHGTPITVTAEMEEVSPTEIVDRYHRINTDALLTLGCAWQPNIDQRGPEYGGALFNRTSDPDHADIVQRNFLSLLEAGLFERKTMQQYYEVREGGGRFLPDRYVEGTCPNCSEDGARGDQCDSCGTTYEAFELRNPISKMNPSAQIEIRDTEHFFYRLDRFQERLEEHAAQRKGTWKPNVRAMTKQWLEMGLRPRAVTRDLDWGIPLPLDKDEWSGKCVYVWFEAVQGYLSCARIWANRYANESGHPDGMEAWRRWWCEPENGDPPLHMYFLGKDNIPFHTVIWPALIMGLNHAAKGRGPDDEILPPSPGDLHLEDDVPAMEYLMLSGGQFSKSRKHAVWLPSFLERFDPDTLRYHLGINMPEAHDTNFDWHDFVDKVNNELIGTYGNFVHRVLTLGLRIPGDNPLSSVEDLSQCSELMVKMEDLHTEIGGSLDRQRYKESLRNVMNAAQLGNKMLQMAAPWKHLKDRGEDAGESLARLAFGWRVCRFLAITSQPFMPFSAQRLWTMLGQPGEVSEIPWSSAVDWAVPITWSNEAPEPLFDRLDLDAIIETEQSLVDDDGLDTGHNIKGSGSVRVEEEGDDEMKWLDFATFQSVDLRTGTITSIEDHPNADRLYVVTIDDGSEKGRTVCAGLKDYIAADEMVGRNVVFVANLEPRPLRGVTSEGMLLAADDGEGNVRLITTLGDIRDGSTVR